MQRSRLPPRTFSLLAWRLPIPLERSPHGFPILGGLKQPCGQRAQLFRSAAKFPSLKRVFAFDFDVSYYDGEHLFVDINTRYPIGHSSSWPGAESVLRFLKQGRRLWSLLEGTTMPNYSLKPARSGSDSVTASTSPLSSRPRHSGPL